MTVITDPDFDQALLPKQLHREKKQVINLAVGCGWALHLVNNHARIKSPGGEKTYSLGNRDSIPAKRMVRDILKFGDPVKVVAISSAVHGGLDPHTAEALLRMDIPKGDPKPEYHPPLPGFVDVPVEILDPPAEPTDLVPADTHIISIKPMVAKRSKRSGYTSATTNQRTWSDGTTDYICTECDYTSTDRIAVGRHYGSTHSRGKGPQPTGPTFKANVTDAAVYAPRLTRVQALAAALAAAADGEPDWEEVARSALTWVHEQTGDLSPEVEPMTDGEMLARIRRLLDTGQMAESQARITEMEERLVFQAQQLAKGDELLLDANHRAAKAQSNLDALAELLAGLREEKGAEPHPDQQA